MKKALMQTKNCCVEFVAAKSLTRELMMQVLSGAATTIAQNHLCQSFPTD